MKKTIILYYHFFLADNNALVVNEDVNCERSQKDDQRGIKFSL